MYKRYENYKASGVEWIGEIPEQWEVSKLKSIAKIYGRIGFRGYQKEDLVLKGEGALTLGAKHINSYNQINLSNPEYISWEKYYESPEIMLKVGDIIITQRGSIGKVGILTDDIGHATINPSLVVLKKIMINNKYLYYYFNSHYFLCLIDALTSSTAVPMISQGQLNNIDIFFPDSNVQEAIANFLNIKTSEIDSLIAEKEELIKKLEEYKQSIITEAVTKGCNPDVKMKDSGIEWIGEIPEQWEALKLRYIGKAIIGLTYSPTDVVSEGEGRLVLRASNVKDGKVIIGQNDVYVNTSIPEKLLVLDGDVLICSRSGSKNLVGKCGMIDSESNGHTFGVFMTVFRSEKNKYLFYIFQSQLFKSQIGSFLTTTINQLTINFLNNLTVPLPPDNEQIEIYEYLKDKTSEIEELLEDIKSHINNLKQYRQSLIYEAVTGKIDVRDYQSERSEQLA